MARKSKYGHSETSKLQSLCKWIAGVYLRLSVEDGDDIEINSIGNQKKIIMAFLSGRLDIEVGDVYVDHGHSGMTYKRPGFQRM